MSYDPEIILRKGRFVKTNEIVRFVQKELQKALHSAIRAAVKQAHGSIKGTTNIRTNALNELEQAFIVPVKGNLAKAVTHLWRALRAEVNTPWPPASRPGFPPHKRTGIGQRAISRGVFRKIGPGAIQQMIFLKANGHYMADLEVGIYTRNLLPRPWLEPVWIRERKNVERIAKKGY